MFSYLFELHNIKLASNSSFKLNVNKHYSQCSDEDKVFNDSIGCLMTALGV